MMNERRTCDPQALEKFLNDQLSTHEQTELESHLESCLDCQRRLELNAASDNFWSEAVNVLSESDPLGDTNPCVGDYTSTAKKQVSLSFLAPTDDPHMLGRFAGYEIAGVVGAGGMGVVLKALDPALHRFSAIKVLSPHYASSEAARQRFSREAQAAAAVVHDNVVAIYGVGESNNLPYLVMPYVRGQSLQKRIDRSAHFSVAEILRIAYQTALGLSAAHEQGLVHRDIKPGNILLPEGVERVLITDFGLACAADDASLTRTDVIAGTPDFMSPEQARGETLDGRSDLFSLGSLMYVMCTGRLPFRAETAYGVLCRINDTAATPIQEVNSDIPLWLCRLIERLQAKRPEDRFQTAKELAEILQQCLAHVQTETTPLPSVLAPQGVFNQVSRGWFIAVASAIVLAVAFFGVLRISQDASLPAVETQSNLDPPEDILPSKSLPTEPILHTELNQWNDSDFSIEPIRQQIDLLDESSDRFFD